MKVGYSMEIEIIQTNERGVTITDWLDSRHSFSFGSYQDMERLNFGTLRVLNEDIVKGGKGFDEHRHENMEIVTLLLEGSLKHKDSTHAETLLVPGDIQRMSAGSGITHSEYNASTVEPVHFLQIWIYPKERGLTPSYEQKNFESSLFKNTLYPVVTKEPSAMALTLHQDAILYRGDLEKGHTVSYTPSSKNRGVFLFVISGKVSIVDNILSKGDAAQIRHADQFEIEVLTEAKLLLIDVSLFTL